MALTDESNGNGFYMPVAPAYGGGYGNGGGFGFGGDWAWILLLLLIGGNGWGMGGFGGGMMPFMMGGMAGGWDLYPWLDNSQHISDGFRDQMLQSNVSSLGDKITSGFGDVATQLCGGFAGVNASINGGVNSLSQQINANQLASLERSFAAQTANTAGMNALQAQQAQCCCDTRAGIADLRYTVATEACADRAAVGDALQAVTMQGVQNTNALLTTLNSGIQSIKDQLCQDKIDAKNDTIAQLRSELMYARGQASQDVQTAQIRAGQVAEVDALYNRLAACPVPTYNVPNPNCCYNSCGCGCGAN